MLKKRWPIVPSVLLHNKQGARDVPLSEGEEGGKVSPSQSPKEE